MPGPETPSVEPVATDQPMQLGEKPKATPERQVNKEVARTLGKYEDKVEKANDKDQAQSEARKAADALEQALNKDPKLVQSLQDGFSKDYKSVFNYFDKDGWTVSFDYNIKKQDGKMKVTLDSHLMEPAGSNNPPPP